MSPDYENKSLVPYNINSSMVEEELKAAGVWEQGFEVAFVYEFVDNNYAYGLYAAENKIADLFASMSPKFNVSVLGIGFMDYRIILSRNYLPIFDVGWLADFGDPENLARTYMHSEGLLASMQDYSDTHVDPLVDLGLSQADGAERNATYQELQYIYWRDVPSLPLFQSTGRRWSRDWVRGWYYNPLCTLDLTITICTKKPRQLQAKAAAKSLTIQSL